MTGTTTVLYRDIERILTPLAPGAFLSTHDIVTALAQFGRPAAIHDVAFALRRMRNAGALQRRSLGTSGHAWRLPDVRPGEAR